MQFKKIFFIITLLFVKHSYAFLSYMNDEDISFKTIVTGDCCTSINYNIINNSDGNIGGKKRLYGIHNMSIEIQGFEVIDLVKNDICIYPHLFTILNNILSNNNIFVQRWECVKCCLPLSFGFKVENNMLYNVSSIWKYRILSILRAKETIPLIKKNNFSIDNTSNEHLKITVSINGRSVEVEQKTIVQIYSISSLHPLAVLARCLFL